MPKTRITRRGFLATARRGTMRIGIVAAVGTTGIELATRRPRILPRETVGAPHLRPPGALAETEFLARCIRCQRCSEACSVGAIQLPGSEAGILHGTPIIRPQQKACTLCLRCGKACPTGAIQSLEKKDDARIGLAKVDKRLCVSHNGTGACGACYTACPLRGKAITQEMQFRPIVVEEKCVGCGQCEEVCIVHDNKAIRVWARPREVTV